jgi:hypothetical protein
MRRLGLPELLSTRKHRKRQLVLAMIAARILEPCSKLATAQRLNSDTLSSSLGEAVGVGQADADDLYEALDWLVRGQARIEGKLAERHLEEGALVLWDVTPVPFESRTSELAAFGRPRGTKKSQRQLLFGLTGHPTGRAGRRGGLSRKHGGSGHGDRLLWTGSSSDSGSRGRSWWATGA